MLFHITHTHSEHTCPYHNNELATETFGRVLSTMESEGVTVVGAYLDAPAHELYMVVEADAPEQIQAGLDPIIDQGHARIQPVVDYVRRQ